MVAVCWDEIHAVECMDLRSKLKLTAPERTAPQHHVMNIFSQNYIHTNRCKACQETRIIQGRHLISQKRGDIVVGPIWVIIQTVIQLTGIMASAFRITKKAHQVWFRP